MYLAIQMLSKSERCKSFVQTDPEIAQPKHFRCPNEEFDPPIRLECVQLSSGFHYLQEDHPDVIGANVKEWLIELGIGSRPKQKLAL